MKRFDQQFKIQYSTHDSLARYIRIVEVSGSNPLCSTK